MQHFFQADKVAYFLCSCFSCKKACISHQLL